MTDLICAQLADFAANQRDHGLDDHLISDAISRLTDTLGVALAAVHSEPGRIARELTKTWGGAQHSTALGLTNRIPACNAALVNGTLAHALDYDDTHVPSILHPSASVVPAALAAAEAADSPVEMLLAAVVVGNEIAVRLGNGGYNRALNNSVFFERGLHATSICGAIGSAAAAATAFGLDRRGIANSMGIAASMGAGLLEANRVGGTVKRMHCGWAAHSGVTAAEMARSGVTGPQSVFEGRFGFFHAYCGEQADLNATVDGLGHRWEINNLFMKPYPTNVFTQTGIDIARSLRADGIQPADVRSVRLGVPSSVLRTIAQPREAKIAPQSGYHAQFSGPFTFAIALHGGTGLGVYLDDFTDDVVADPSRLRLASRVTHEPDPRAEAGYPMQFPTVARVELIGETRELTAMHNRGSAQNPLTETEVATKFGLNARRALSSEAAEEFAKRLANVDQGGSITTLLEPTREIMARV